MIDPTFGPLARTLPDEGLRRRKHLGFWNPCRTWLPGVGFALVAMVALATPRLAAQVAIQEPAPAQAAPAGMLPPGQLTAPATDIPVRLPAAEGWEAWQILDNKGVGIWTVEAIDLTEAIGSLEVIGLDDLGRAHICTEYSGRWTTRTLGCEGKWLGGLAHGDIDHRLPGKEAYVGSQQGNLYQIVSHAHGVLDYRLIAWLPGREIHTIVVNRQSDEAAPGGELIVFTNPGGIWRVTPTGQDGKFESVFLGDTDGRVRQAVQLPGTEGSPVWATVSRNGKLDAWRFDGAEPVRSGIHHDATMGLGRLALGRSNPGAGTVLYAAHDDGRIIRVEQQPDGLWKAGTIFAGDHGPRGILTGRVTAGAGDGETLVIGGYNQKVQLLQGNGAGWSATTVFEDTDRIHWLGLAEMDGRNGTDEILVSGYGGRIVLLSRPPGYGLDGVRPLAPK